MVRLSRGGGWLQDEAARDSKIGGRGFGPDLVGRDCGGKARARQCFCPKKAARGIYEKVAGTPQVAGYLALSGQEPVGQKKLVGQERPARFGLSVRRPGGETSRTNR